MLFINNLSEAGRSTIISISSLIILIIESIPFGIILNLVAELGQLCNMDLRFGLSTIYLLQPLPQIVEFESMFSFEELNAFVILFFPLFTGLGSLWNRSVTKAKTKINIFWSRFVPPFMCSSAPSPIQNCHTTLGPILHFFTLLHHHLLCTFTFHMIDPNATAANHSADKYNTSIGLQEYNPSTPPGWKPGPKNYPI